VALGRWLSLIDTHFDAQAPSFSDIWYLIGLLNGAQLGQGALQLQVDWIPDINNIPRPGGPPVDPNLPPARRFETLPLFQPGIAIKSGLFGDKYTQYRREALPALLQLAQDALHNASLPTIYNSSVYTATSAVAALSDHFDWFQQRSHDSFEEDTLTNFTALHNAGVMDSNAFLRGLGNHSWAFSFAGLDEGGVDHTGYADHLQAVSTQDSFFYWVTTVISSSVAGCNAQPRDQSGCDFLRLMKMSLKAEVLAEHWYVLPDAFSMGIQYPGQPVYFDDWARGFACGNAVRADLNDVFQHEEFVETLGPGTTAVVTSLVERLYNELGSTLLANQWLDQATRTRAMNKWQLMTKNIAYESSWDNDQYGLVVTGNWYLDMVAGHSYATQRLLSTLEVPADMRSPTVITFGMMNPFVPNAFYMPSLNSINMLPGLMFFPFFDVRLPFALNVASYGFAIGHEMTHGFDNAGRHFDALGQEADWWTPTAASAFDKHAQCFVDQYSSYQVWNQSVDGAKTLGENIADNGGLGIASRVYAQLTKGADQFLSGTAISNEQLFYIWASQLWCQSDNAATMKASIATDVHSPGEVRSFAPMRNQEAFARAFHCPSRSFMVNTSRCNVW